MAPYRETPSDPESDEGDDVVAIASYYTAVDAELSRMHLNEKGIFAVVQESARFNPLVNVAAGGIRLLVKSADEADARRLLRLLSKAEPQEDDEPGQVRCPRCEQTYCTFGTVLATTSFGGPVPPGFLLFLLPFGLTRKRWRCQRCEHVWDDPKAGPTKKTPLHPDDPQPVFRLRRRSGLAGGTLGLLAGFLAMVVISRTGIPGPLLLVLPVITVLVGARIGRRVYTDVCSNPDCRAALPASETDCRSCHGAIAGEIESANQHWSEAAAVRRELWAIRQEEESAPRDPDDGSNAAREDLGDRGKRALPAKKTARGETEAGRGKKAPPTKKAREGSKDAKKRRPPVKDAGDGT